MRNPQSQRLIRLIAATSLTLLCAATPALAEGGGIHTGDLGQAIAAIVIFLLLLLILGKWAWKPIISQLHNRERRIALSIERIKDREKQSQELLDEYTRRMDQAQAESQELLAGARREMSAIKARTIAEARKESRKFASDARREITEARAEALKEVQQVTAELAVEIASKLMDEEFDAAAHNRLLKQSMEDIRRYQREQT